MNSTRPIMARRWHARTCRPLPVRAVPSPGRIRSGPRGAREASQARPRPTRHATPIPAWARGAHGGATNGASPNGWPGPEVRGSLDGEDLGPTLGHQDGVLELRRPLAVVGHRRPAVVPEPIL